jgi:hypothetical protein
VKGGEDTRGNLQTRSAYLPRLTLTCSCCTDVDKGQGVTLPRGHVPIHTNVKTPALHKAESRHDSSVHDRIEYCAAKAFYSCPAIISRRPGSQNTSKEPQLNSEKDSRRKQARSHVT